MANQLALRERELCEHIKVRIYELPRMKESFLKAELSFPGVTDELPPSEAIDLIMREDIVSSDQARRGIEAGPVQTDIQCYKTWLLRVERGCN